MFRISEKASTILSLIFTGAALALLVVLTCTLPSIVGWYLAMTARPELDRTAITVLLYIALVPAYAAALALLALLRKVQRDEIFTQKAVGNLRLVSYCCLAECGADRLLPLCGLHRLCGAVHGRDPARRQERDRKGRGGQGGK